MIKINEIFNSIQGESSWAGWPTVFIRTSGCHLRCDYCDTKYAYHEGYKISVEDIVHEVQKFSSEHVCITGGEPLLQKEVHDLMTTLCDLGYNVSLETSGDLDCRNVDSRVKKIIDIKTPDSGESGRFHAENLTDPNVNTEFKFVICSQADFDWAEEFVKEHRLNKRCTVLYSPSFHDVDKKWLAKKILSVNSPARLQLQLHKFIWSSEDRGV